MTDTVRGFIAVAENDTSVGEVINIGSNFEISVAETVKVIAETIGTEVRIISDDARIRPQGSEVERLWADNTKARKLLGWSPEYGQLEGFKRGIAETVAWFKKPENQSGYKSERYKI